MNFIFIYFVLMKKPAKTRRGRTNGTTIAAAASGDGIDNPITAPTRKIEF